MTLIVSSLGPRWILCRAVALLLSFLLSLLLLSCGGGGGGGSEVSLRSPARVELSMLERNTRTTLQVPVPIDGVGAGQLVYIGLGFENGNPEAMFSDVRLGPGSSFGEILIELDVRADLAPGRHEIVLRVAVCGDAQCTKTQGAAVKAPIVIDVRPNISVAAQVVLSRTGSEPAPVIEVPIMAPPEAGTLHVLNNYGGAPVSAEVVGNVLRITTQQVRSGTYRQQVAIVSLDNSSYFAFTDVVYQVLPPPDGERGMSTNPGGMLTLSLTDGQVVTRRISLSKATWSKAPVTAVIGSQDTPEILSLRQVQEDEFDLTVDTRGRAPGGYHAQLLFSGAPEVGLAALDVLVLLNPAIRVSGPAQVALTATSTLADSRWSSPVEMADGAVEPWTANVPQPWLRLARSSGLTGRDALEVEVDAAMLPQYPFNQTAFIEVSVGRAGVLPVIVPYSMVNAVPALSIVAPGALVGNSGRIYLSGAMLTKSDLLTTGVLSISGATVRNVSYIHDSRFIADRFMVVIDVDGAVPGTTVTATVDTPILRTQHTVPVLPLAAPSAAHVDLPFGARRPAVWSAKHGAWYFAGDGRVHRYAALGAGPAQSSVALPGVIDVDVAPEEGVLLAVSDGNLHGLDPVSLEQRWQAAQEPDSFARVIDTRTAVLQKALAHNADGTVFISVRAPNFATSGVAPLFFDWVHPNATFFWDFGHGGSTFDAADNPPFGITVSASRETNVLSRGTQKDLSTRYIFRAAQRRFVPGYTDFDLDSVPGGVTLVGNSDDGTRFLTADGQVFTRNGRLTLGNALAAGRTPLGYALTGDGLFAVVYSAIFTGAGASQVAGSPEISVVDLRGTPMANRALASIPMLAPVGCATPRAAAESCLHDASLAVDLHSRMVFVLGPRGAEIVPLPPSVQRSLSANRKVSARR